MEEKAAKHAKATIQELRRDQVEEAVRLTHQNRRMRHPHAAPGVPTPEANKNMGNPLYSFPAVVGISGYSDLNVLKGNMLKYKALDSYKQNEKYAKDIEHLICELSNEQYSIGRVVKRMQANKELACCSTS